MKSRYRIRPGGLMRCCLDSLDDAMVEAVVAPQEGDTVNCAYHDPPDDPPTMIFKAGAWEWNQAPPKPTPAPRHDVPVSGNGHRKSDMVISIHALERMETRWPGLCEGLTDEEVARVIQGEINDAVVGGRYGDMCPLELANNNVERWRARKGVWFSWNEDKTRGFAVADDWEEGVVVLTTLIGDTAEKARQKLIRRR